MKISDHFYLQEFVPESIYSRFGQNSLWFIDPKVISIAGWIRDYFEKPLIINTWHMGGNRQYSGFRPPATKVGALLSQHRYGRAMDFYITSIPAQEIQLAIKKNFLFLKQLGLTTMEAGTDTWTHLDVRFTNSSDLLLVNP